MNGFGSYLREHREARGLSLRELSQLCGVSYSHISRMESGEKRTTTTETLGALERGLRLGPHQRQHLRLLYVDMVTADVANEFGVGPKSREPVDLWVPTGYSRG